MPSPPRRPAERNLNAPEVPPRPLEAEPEGVARGLPVPWHAFMTALVLGAAAGAAALSPPAGLVVWQGLAQAHWTVVFYLAFPVIAAAGPVLAACIMDRIAPSWPRALRWALGMGLARALPFAAMVSFVALGGRWQSQLMLVLWPSLWVALAGAALGLVLGSVPRAARGGLWRMLGRALAYEAGLFLAYRAVATPPGSGFWPTMRFVWSDRGFENWCPTGLIAAAAIGLALALHPRRRLESEEEPARPASWRRLVPAVALVALCGAALHGVWVNAGRQALLETAHRGDAPRVGRLIDRGVNPNRYAIEARELPLDAALRQSPEALEVLLQRGADVDGGGRGRGTALHDAATVGELAAAKVLLKYGADLDRPGSFSDRTPLHEALMHTLIEMTELLVEAGADPNARDRSGQTPLHYAAAWGSPRAVSLLLEHGADPSAADNIGRTPLDSAAHATDYRSARTVELLTEAESNSAADHAN